MGKICAQLQDAGLWRTELALRCCATHSVPNTQCAGSPYQRIFPHNDPRVVRVLKKIVRGLAYSKKGDVIAEDRVGLIPPTCPPPTGFQDDFTPVYVVQHVFGAWALFFSEPEASDMHSLWVLEFLENVRFDAVIAAA